MSKANLSVNRSTSPLWVPILAVLGIIAASGLGGLATSSSINDGWYSSLQKASVNPPNYVFGPAWTFLYILMGVAFVLCWKTASAETNGYKVAFAIQITLNLLWSVAFFGMKSPELGLIVILAMIGAIIFNIVMFAKVNRTSAWLMAPYLAWVCFATYLNASIVVLNR